MARNPWDAFNSNSAEAASQGANQADFLGEGTADPAAAGAPAAPARPAVDPLAARNAQLHSDADATANQNATVDKTGANQGSSFGTQDSADAFASGNVGGATGAYNAGNAASRAGFDYMHDLGNDDMFISGSTLLNRAGEKAGVTHLGDVANPDLFAGGINNPMTDNPLSAIGDPNTGLGISGVNSGKPIASIAPEASALATQGIGKTAGDALSQAMGGLGGSDIPVDTSGGDRGTMGLNGDYSTQLNHADNQAQADRELGQGVLNGQVAPGGAGAQGQQDALDKAMAFLPSAQKTQAGKVDAFQGGPRAANDVMGQLDAFGAAPAGPSAAELQLQQASQGNMSDALSLARSGRARDAGSQARALNTAMAENAATGVDTARDTAMLRAKEESDRRGQNLQALTAKGGLAQGLDQNTLSALGLGSDLAKGTDSSTLSALGLGGDLANQIRTGNIAERGQGLNFAQGQEQIGAGLQSDALKTIPQLENIRHADQFDLTPQQKLAAAKLGGTPDKTTADYVTGLLGDVLSAL